ncbi:hypothetical protein [uncultured Anaeromusa sp.]|uniref:hypothetical protein n=1 Tax=uncultured Anaeromusa sp. TaxID=673273 RepID=UPI0029C7760A|nr:hypothetical protein [uncultured Anaeromusa sp.]
MAYQPRCPGAGRKFHQGGIQKTELIVPPANSTPTERRMTFAEAVDRPELFCLHTAAANYKQSEPKCITPKRLMNCAEAGLSAAEIAHGFDCSQATVYNKLKKCGIKLKPDSVAQAIQAAEDKIDAKKMAEEVMAELGKEEPAIEERKPAVINEEFEAEFAKPMPPGRVDLLEGVTAEEIAANIKQNNELFLQTGLARGDTPAPTDEYTLVFSPAEKLAELVVNKDGDVLIRNCEMDLQLRYVLKFKPDLTGLLVASDPKGFELRTKGNSFRIGCGAIRKALTAAGIELPARYRLDIEEMTGVLL